VLNGRSRGVLPIGERPADPSQWVASEGPAQIPPDTAAIEWSRLSRSERKPASFAIDTEFRLVWDELTRRCDVYRYAHDCGLIVFKAEAMLYPERVLRAISLCIDQGYDAIFCRAVRFDAARKSLLWRYQFNRATPSRLRAMLCLGGEERCLVLILRARAPDRVPVAVRLAMLKGSGLKAQRDPRTLRGIFEPPNPLINFVHASDEPIDFLRETGVLLSYDERRRLYRTCEALPVDAALAIAADACAASRGLATLPDPQAALAELRTASLEALGHGNPIAAYVDRLARHSEYMDLEKMLELLETHAVTVDPAALLVAACHTMIKTYDGMAERAEKVPVQRWGVEDLASPRGGAEGGPPPDRGPPRANS